MKYTVTWVPKAEQLLTQLWLDSDSAMRQVLTKAAHEIDQRLKMDPEEEGESRPGNRRILFVPPLGVIFEVLPQDCKVRVAVVWNFDTH